MNTSNDEVMKILDDVLINLDDNKSIKSKLEKMRSLLLLTRDIAYKLIVVNSELKIFLPLKLQNVYVRLSYHYNWILSLAFSPITTTFELKWNSEDKYWYADISGWINKNKLHGYKIKVQPFFEKQDNEMSMLPAAWIIA